jgi:DNA-binding Lrp family transcriptional regulator
MIDTEQLELLRDPKNMPLLQLLMKPHTASEAAKHFGLSNNALHYRFKKLFGANLIKEVESRGNRRKYQVVAERFTIPKEDVPSAETVWPELYEEKLQLVQKHFTGVNEKYFRDKMRSKKGGYLYIHLKGRLVFPNFKPALVIREVELTEKQYSELSELMLNFLREAVTMNHNANEQHTKTCTITHIACKGGAISSKAP